MAGDSSSHGNAGPVEAGEGMVLITVLLCTLLRGSKLQVGGWSQPLCLPGRHWWYRSSASWRLTRAGAASFAATAVCMYMRVLLHHSSLKHPRHVHHQDALADHQRVITCRHTSYVAKLAQRLRLQKSTLCVSLRRPALPAPLAQESKRKAVSMLCRAAMLCHDEVRLQTVAPHLLALITQSEAKRGKAAGGAAEKLPVGVRALALRCLVRLVASVAVIPPSDAKVGCAAGGLWCWLCVRGVAGIMQWQWAWCDQGECACCLLPAACCLLPAACCHL